MFPYIIQGTNITVVIDNVPHTISSTHMCYETVRTAIKNNDWDTVKQQICIPKFIADYSEGNVSIAGDKAYWKQQELHGVIVKRLIDMFKEGFSVVPLVNFLNNLMQNPAKTAINELYEFLEAGNLPITPDGCFLAYKRINVDYKDIHSNTVLNKPAALMTPAEIKQLSSSVNDRVKVQVRNGTTFVSMERQEVDPNRNNHCSTGLHFCSLSYLATFTGERTIILKINPKDVVSIPSDYNHTKGRCCAYEIVGEIPNGELTQAFTNTVQDTATNIIPETVSYDIETDAESEQDQCSQKQPTGKKPLSMTPNAIRKREKRLRKKLLKGQQ